MAGEESAGVSEYLHWVRRRLYPILMVLVAGLVLAAIVAFALPPAYNSPAEFRISRTYLPDAQGNASYVDEYVSSLTHDVMTPDNLRPIVEEFGLYPEYEGDPGRQVGELVGDTHVEMVTQRILDPSSGREREIHVGFTVTYDADTPEGAKGVTTAIANLMVDVGRQQRADQAGRIAGVLSEQAVDYGKRIAELEQALADFKETNYARLPDSAGLNVVTRERTESDLDNVEAELRALQQNRIFLQSQLSQARQAGPDTVSIAQLEDEYRRKGQSYDASHPDMIALRRQIDALKAGRHSSNSSLRSQLDSQRSVLTEARQRYSEDHPDVRRIQRNIEALEARIAAGETTDSSAAVENNSAAVVQLQTQLNANNAQAASLQARAAELRGKLGSIESRMQSAPEVEREYSARVRELELEREKYSDLLRREMDARGEQTATMAGGREAFDLVRTPGTPGSPAKPRRAAIIILGLVLSAFLALGVALLMEMFDSTIRGSRDVSELLGVTPLAVVPEIRNSRFQARRSRKIFGTVVGFAAATPLLYFMIWNMVR